MNYKHGWNSMEAGRDKLDAEVDHALITAEANRDVLPFQDVTNKYNKNCNSIKTKSECARPVRAGCRTLF
jgi:hypothetical protein